MPDDALDQLLRLVAEGRLTADEAAPILDALETRSADERHDEPSFRFEQRATAGASKASSDDAPARAIRIQVSGDGRDVVNLRVPAGPRPGGARQHPRAVRGDDRAHPRRPRHRVQGAARPGR